MGNPLGRKKSKLGTGGPADGHRLVLNEGAKKKNTSEKRKSSYIKSQKKGIAEEEGWGYGGESVGQKPIRTGRTPQDQFGRKHPCSEEKCGSARWGGD